MHLDIEQEHMGKAAIVSVDESMCKGADACGICIALCPKGVFSISDRLTARGARPPVVVELSACNACGNCMIFCPDMAIVVCSAGSPETAATGPTLT